HSEKVEKRQLAALAIQYLEQDVFLFANTICKLLSSGPEDKVIGLSLSALSQDPEFKELLRPYLAIRKIFKEPKFEYQQDILLHAEENNLIYQGLKLLLDVIKQDVSLFAQYSEIVFKHVHSEDESIVRRSLAIIYE